MITETKSAGRRHMMVPELKLTKKVTADEDESGLMLPRIVAEKPREVERWRFHVFVYGTVKHTDTWEVVRDTICLHRREKRQNRVEMNSESESERLSREPWREKAGGKHARTESLRECETEK